MDVKVEDQNKTIKIDDDIVIAAYREGKRMEVSKSAKPTTPKTKGASKKKHTPIKQRRFFWGSGTEGVL